MDQGSGLRAQGSGVRAQVGGRFGLDSPVGAMMTAMPLHMTPRQISAVARTVALLSFLFGWAAPAWAQAPDIVLVNGKILTVDPQSSIREAIAVRDGRIVAIGATAEVRRLAGAASRVIDLQGRTVIPGLIDSHLHAIRAALSFATEVNWIGARSLEEALGRISQAARTMKPGAWLIVAGGWNEQQFVEKRRPTQAELEAAAPDNPVYVQLGYGWAMS